MSQSDEQGCAVDSPVGSLNKGRVLDETTGKLWERFAELGDTLRLHFEATFLGHSGVPTEWGYISEKVLGYIAKTLTYNMPCRERCR